MCSACALAAMAGATSARAWLALHVPALRDPRRMRAVTAGLLTAALLMPSVGLSGSGAPVPSSAAPPAPAPR
ncbi:MAG: hypothetical protein J7513_05320 [Solirubrobacteraceae bacterium]|nr:hypothetical protein [Solirubrobacteraceae bacterium]